MITDINSEDRLVQETFADHLERQLGWESVYAYNRETFGPVGTLGRNSERDIVLTRDLRAALRRLNPEIPAEALEQAVEALAGVDFSRSIVQQNQEFAGFIRNGVPVQWRDANGQTHRERARVIDFQNGATQGVANNRFLAVRELKIQGLRVPHYYRRADLVCYVNGLPLVFFELKAVYKNIRAGFDNNLTDYLTQSIPHAFYHNVFLVVSNGHRAKYGSITSKWEHFAEWKRLEENEPGRLDAETLLNGMMRPDRLLDIVENFVLFDNSRAGGARKIVARNHQVIGVNRAVASVLRQEELKKQFPPEGRIVSYAPQRESRELAVADHSDWHLPLVKRAHPDLGLLGVFWHTQGSGKSYSMAFFAEKVRRVVPGNFTFVLMTDRDDLDSQLRRTFVGCGVADEHSPRAGSGRELHALLRQNHRYIFTLIHKFNQEEEEAYSLRDDIIVISDEAHRTQSGKFARKMRLALPNASFIGFTGTPLFKNDHLTRRLFGSYISRYDFKRSQEDNATVKLMYENRGEKLGVARLDLNDRIAEKIEEAGLDSDQKAKLDKLLGKDYEVITAPKRLDQIADDFVEHVSTRWEAGKSMLVCIDKLTCARMYQRIGPRWQAKVSELKGALSLLDAEAATLSDADEKAKADSARQELRNRIAWMETTRIEIIISEAQNEVRDFKQWDFNIIPHRMIMKTGFETSDGKRVSVEDAFKDPAHPFRIAIVCAMWLTGFDVECLSTLYIDKPMKAHTLMQAIARANRVYPGKECGVIVDYNGMLKSLREALAQYALGDDVDAGGVAEIVAPPEELLAALVEVIEAAEEHLLGLGFDTAALTGAKGFAKIKGLADAVDALGTSDDARLRFEIMAREVFVRFKSLLMEPSVFRYAVRHDNIEAIYKKLEEKRDLSDVTDVLKELHKIVNEAIRAQGEGDDQAEGLTMDLSRIDFQKLREEFAKKVQRKHAVLQDIRQLVEEKLAQMLARNPERMDYYKRYQEIVADYNREKDRVSVEETFAKLARLVADLDEEQTRHVREGLSEEELALFDLLCREGISKTDREKLKQASKNLLASLQASLKEMRHWTKNTQTQADVETLIRDSLWRSLPRPPFTEQDTERLIGRVYSFVFQQSFGGAFPQAAGA